MVSVDTEVVDVRNERLKIWQLAVPAIAQSLLHTMSFVLSRWMVGRHSTEALASLQLSGPVFWTMVSVLSAFQVSLVAVAGRLVGAGNWRAAGASVRFGLCLALSLGIGLVPFAMFSEPFVMSVFSETSPNIRALAHDYLSALYWGAPGVLVSGMLSSAFAVSGDTRTPIIATIIANIVTLVGGFGLLFGRWGLPQLGVSGAGWAMAFAFYLEAMVLFWLLRRKGVFDLSWSQFRVLDLQKQWRAFWPIAGPSVMEFAVLDIGYFAFIGVLAGLGPHAMAANQVMISIESVCFLSAEGFATAARTLVAHRVGAEDIPGARRVGWSATWWTVISLSVVGLFFFLYRDVLGSAFTPESATQTEVARSLPIAALAQPFMAVGVVLAASIAGAGATRLSFFVACVGGLVVRLVLAVLFVRVWGWGLRGVWLASTGDWIVRTAILIVMFRSHVWLPRNLRDGAGASARLDTVLD